MSLVSVVDADRQCFPAIAGLTGWAAEARGTPLSHSFCQHVVSTGTLVVDDALDHPILRDNDAIADLGVRAYLGVPLVSASGHRLGAFCAVDGEPRVWTDAERELMEDLAAAVSTDLQLRLLASAHAHAATHDALTAMPNRRLLMTDLEDRVAAGAAPSILAILDLDGFKTYNDTFGHLAGDDLLRRIGGSLVLDAERLGGSVLPDGRRRVLRTAAGGRRPRPDRGGSDAADRDDGDHRGMRQRRAVACHVGGGGPHRGRRAPVLAQAPPGVRQRSPGRDRPRAVLTEPSPHGSERALRVMLIPTPTRP
ncbi:MAG: diguanylate cyclase/phosphodiesterase with sensor [Solirubrobacterales bacterium]|nr:diguanylate cyclase/phosphodiesterase with sensor [Solirubrobacterales bacterium]